MFLEKIRLTNFKNYKELSLDLNPLINCLVGQNGTGKTNLLDAIHYLCLTKSVMSLTDQQLLKQGEDVFVLQGTFKADANTDKIHIGYASGSRRVVKANDVPYQKVGDHIGKFPLVMLSPYDSEIIQESGEMRRKFFDSMPAQYDAVYLDDLLRYSNLIRQRNSLLKQFAERRTIDNDLLDGYDNEVIRLSKRIYTVRKNLLSDYEPVFQRNYAFLSDEKEHPILTYRSDVSEPNFEEAFTLARQKDVLLQRTTLGVHKDDVVFDIREHMSLKKYGSQGQQKSFVVALQLAKFQHIEAIKGIKPILLLDDIFDKLDEARIGKLLQMVATNTFGQVFITDASVGRTRQLFANHSIPYKEFGIDNGETTYIEEVENDK